MPRVKLLGVNPTEQKIVALLYGAMEREGLQKRDIAAALGMTTATLLRRKKNPLDFTLGELQKPAASCTSPSKTSAPPSTYNAPIDPPLTPSVRGGFSFAPADGYFDLPDAHEPPTTTVTPYEPQHDAVPRSAHRERRPRHGHELPPVWRATAENRAATHGSCRRCEDQMNPWARCCQTRARYLVNPWGADRWRDRAARRIVRVPGKPPAGRCRICRS